MNTYFCDHFQTPIGKMEITATENTVTSINFVDHVGSVNKNSVTEQAKQQMLEYFAGDREEFDLPLGAQGTDFQKQVWRELVKVGYGKTCSYSDIASAINNLKAVRAVGAANGRNPIAIVVPCHRIIGQNGSLTGYASGLERKAWLLNHESNTLF